MAWPADSRVHAQVVGDVDATPILEFDMGNATFANYLNETYTVRAGDLMILAVNYQNLNTPSGFTFVGSQGRLNVYYKVAAGSSDGVLSVPTLGTAGIQATGILAAFTGAHARLGAFGGWIDSATPLGTATNIGANLTPNEGATVRLVFLHINTTGITITSTDPNDTVLVRGTGAQPGTALVVREIAGTTTGATYSVVLDTIVATLTIAIAIGGGWVVGAQGFG